MVLFCAETSVLGVILVSVFVHPPVYHPDSGELRFLET